jgi:hypothetical protein
MLVTHTDFKFHKMIFVLPGQTQPMEMDIEPKQHQNEMEKEVEKWHSVGTETITVPTGHLFLRALNQRRSQGRSLGQP